MSGLKPIFERWRPTSFSEVVGQERAIQAIERLSNNGALSGRAFWIAGPSGTGKTTIARLLAAEIADEINVDEVDARDLSAAAIRELERDSLGRRLGDKPGRVIIINEAHGLNSAARGQLLTTLERLPNHVAWIFTTTDDGAQKFLEGFDAPPFLSRCAELPMARRGLADGIAARAVEIAIAEQLAAAVDPAELVKRCLELVKQCRNNFRQVLQKIELGYLLDFAN